VETVQRCRRSWMPRIACALSNGWNAQSLTPATTRTATRFGIERHESHVPRSFNALCTATTAEWREAFPHASIITDPRTFAQLKAEVAKRKQGERVDERCVAR